MKKNSYKSKPSVANFNRDPHAGEVLKYFNDIKDKKRMEMVALLDENTFPSVIPKMTGGSVKKPTKKK